MPRLVATKRFCIIFHETRRRCSNEIRISEVRSAGPMDSGHRDNLALCCRCRIVPGLDSALGTVVFKCGAGARRRGDKSKKVGPVGHGPGELFSPMNSNIAGIGNARQIKRRQMDLIISGTAKCPIHLSTAWVMHRFYTSRLQGMVCDPHP